MVSKQCKECVEFIHKNCAGKPEAKQEKYFGTPKAGKKSGANFCSKYEFDESCYPRDNAAFITENNGTIIKRSKERAIEQENQQHSDIADFAAGLSSDDFVGLL